MKSLILTLGMLTATGLATAEPSKTAPSKTTAVKKTVAKTPVAKPATRPAAKHTAKAAAAPAPAPEPEAELGEAELSIARLVYVGDLPCELGAKVQLLADPARPGYFDLHILKQRFRMVPVTSATGAIRLEDAKAGAVWLQLANKSMLMNHKLGQRMADECMSEPQAKVTEQFKTQPPPSLLEPLPAPVVRPQVATGGQ